MSKVWGAAPEPHLAVDGNTVHLVWTDDRDGNEEVYYKRSLDEGESWLEEERVSADEAKSIQPCVSAADNHVHVIWRDDRSGTYEVLYRGGSFPACPVLLDDVAVDVNVGPFGRPTYSFQQGRKRWSVVGARTYLGWYHGLGLASDSCATGDGLAWSDYDPLEVRPERPLFGSGHSSSECDGPGRSYSIYDSSQPLECGPDGLGCSRGQRNG